MIILPPRTFTVDLFRHPETFVNRDGKTMGTDDTQLTPKGISQAIALGTYLARHGYAPNEIHCSSLLRARHLAMIMAAHIGFPLNRVLFSDHLIEIRRGEWTGKSRDEVFTPQEMQRMALLGMDHGAPGGETLNQLADRMYRKVVEICFNGPVYQKPPRIALVGHGLSTACFLQRILGNRPELTWRIGISNTSITTLIYDENGWYVKRINAVPHLDQGI